MLKIGLRYHDFASLSTNNLWGRHPKKTPREGLPLTYPPPSVLHTSAISASVDFSPWLRAWQGLFDWQEPYGDIAHKIKHDIETLIVNFISWNMVYACIWNIESNRTLGTTILQIQKKIRGGACTGVGLINPSPQAVAFCRLLDMLMFKFGHL